MRPNRLALALAFACFALPISALAQDAETGADAAPQDQPAEAPAADEAAGEAESKWSWNLSLTSDYVFRGITQTDRDPALQGGLDYAFDSGIYVGFWGSNVDFADPDGPDIELDTYIGYSRDVSDSVNLDLSLVHYGYFGERSAYGSVDYTEVIGKATWKEMLTFTVAYAPDYSNLDYSSLYFNITGSWEIGNDFSLTAGAGHSDFSEGNGSYNDWTIGISRQFGPVNAALNYYDTNLDYGSDRASDVVVLTLALGS